MKSAPAIAFDYRPSRVLACTVAAGVLLAVVAPWRSDVPGSVCAVLSIAAIVTGITALRGFNRARFRRIALQASGWTLVDVADIEHRADLAAHIRIGPWLVLDFRSAGRCRFRAVLGPGNSDAETRRRLILLLSRAEVAQPG